MISKLYNENKKEKFKKIIGKVDELTLYQVDGDYVRDNIYVDFTEGGHSYVYDFIPKNEVWIEKMIDKDDELFIIMHELREISFMKKGMEYEKAHEKANELESVVRSFYKI